MADRREKEESVSWLKLNFIFHPAGWERDFMEFSGFRTLLSGHPFRSVME